MRITFERYSFTVQVIVIFIAWYMISSASSIVNKITIQKYPYPMTFALATFCCIEIFSTPLFRIWHIKTFKIPRYIIIRYIIPISISRVIAVVSAFFSIWKIPVSYAQTVKATMPLFSVFAARIILRENQSVRVYLSLIPIITGVTIATFTEISFDLYGLLSALLSTGVFSILNVFVKKVLESTDIHPLYLLVINSRLAAIFLFPIWCTYDGLLLWKGVEAAESQSSPYEPYFILYLSLSGLLSFLQNLCAFALIHRLTALSYAVANAAKRITVITVSLLTLHNPVTPPNIFGMFLSIFGVLLYNRAKQYDRVYRSGLPKTRMDQSMSDASLLMLNNEMTNGKVNGLDLPVYDLFRISSTS